MISIASATNWLKLAQPYRKKFGFFRSMRMAWWDRQLRWALPKDTIVQIKLPGYRSPIELRAGSTDLGTFHEVFINEEHAIELDFPPRTICDLGANIGLASLYFANRYPNAQIVAFEPEKENFERLSANTSAYPNIQVVRAAAWPHDTDLTIIDKNKCSNAFEVREFEGHGRE